MQVVACDIDSAQLAMARHNAEVYGVADRIEFVHGDAFAIAAELSSQHRVDAVFVSPPWGGPRPQSSAGEAFDPLTNIPGLGRCAPFRACAHLTAGCGQGCACIVQQRAWHPRLPGLCSCVCCNKDMIAVCVATKTR